MSYLPLTLEGICRSSQCCTCLGSSIPWSILCVYCSLQLPFTSRMLRRPTHAWLLTQRVGIPRYIFMISHMYALTVAAAMSRPQDILEQQRRIGPANKGQYVYPDYGHMDFVW